MRPARLEAVPEAAEEPQAPPTADEPPPGAPPPADEPRTPDPRIDIDFNFDFVFTLVRFFCLKMNSIACP